MGAGTTFDEKGGQFTDWASGVLKQIPVMGGQMIGKGPQEQPAVPDYKGAAEAEAASSMANLQYQTMANRPNAYMPGGGSVEWVPPTEPGGQWTQRTTLGAADQAALESQQRLGAARSSLGETMFGRAQTELGTPADWSSLPGAPDANAARQQAVDATYSQAQSRLDPQWNQRAEGLRTQLLNEGLRPGMQGYDQRMQEFERGRTDAYDTAMRTSILAGEPVAAGEFSRGLQGRQQGVAEMLQKRGTTLNEINALLGGQQVETPQMPGFSQSGVAESPDYMGAATNQYGGTLDQYNAQQAQTQNRNASLLALLKLFA